MLFTQNGFFSSEGLAQSKTGWGDTCFLCDSCGGLHAVSCQHQLLAAAPSLQTGDPSREWMWLCLEAGGTGPQICKRREGFQSDVLPGLLCFRKRMLSVEGFLTKNKLVERSYHVHDSHCLYLCDCRKSG